VRRLTEPSTTRSTTRRAYLPQDNTRRGLIGLGPAPSHPVRLPPTAISPTTVHGGCNLCQLGYKAVPLCRRYAPVAQLDRVSASEAEGRAFESHRARNSQLRWLNALPGPLGQSLALRAPSAARIVRRPTPASLAECASGATRSVARASRSLRCSNRSARNSQLRWLNALPRRLGPVARAPRSSWLSYVAVEDEPASSPVKRLPLSS
jgi:hypothetical protein